MKNFNHPEFHILHKLQTLQTKYPDIPELNEMINEVRDIINENTIAIMQSASLYTLIGKEDDLLPETKNKLNSLLTGAQNSLNIKK